MNKVKTFALVAGASVATFLLGGGIAFAQYDQTTFGTQLDTFTSSTQGFVGTLISHYWVFAVALVVISGVIGFILGHVKGWFHGGRR